MFALAMTRIADLKKKKLYLFVMLINVFFRYTPKMSDIAVVNFQIFKLYMGVKELMI